ncbi:hypothetical protein GCM10022285_65700 [Streptomyces tunisiensis]|uniref:Transposase n=1 Tax=Streptomyces tunisiensis TaxID=948699 RepID=A0ABP7ZBS7_9ACTN
MRAITIRLPGWRPHSSACPLRSKSRALKPRITRENSVSVQDLLNLLAPRTGQMDSASCVQRAKLRKRVRATKRPGSSAKALETVEAMWLHKRYGLAEDD